MTGQHPATGATRRRGDRLTDAIFRAVFDEIDENGYAAVTMETVAKRAHTGKAALYRRWQSRTELIIDAIQSGLPTDDQLPDTGSLRGDLLQLLGTVVAGLTGTVGAALRGLRAETVLNPSLSRQVREHTGDAAATRLQHLIERGVARGQLDGRDITPLRLQAGPAIVRDHFLFRDLDSLPLEELVDQVVLPLLGPSRYRRAATPRPATERGSRRNAADRRPSG
ncbi:MAG: hypothetical protein BGO26_11080 [Actinobacteria bacterium 69-20]|nr:TetR/AcrR family transcriptional regulator [Actinomycetota bacterium]OJV26318.1 MAG: hypothetical protein BGO26_11080 [Actinobacteria bacterium 69-20]